MATWSSAYITALPDSAFACIDSEGRHYPHHNSSGALDLPHLRAALSRLGDASNTQCGKGHIMRHASAEGMGESAQKALKATVIDDDAFRLLAIPFGGPIPLPSAPLGADLQGEWFSGKTDIKPDWFTERPVLWHHGQDRFVGQTLFGKAINLTLDEDTGWWVDVWFKAGERRKDLIRQLHDRGAEIFGSTATIPSLVRKASSGEIEVWPFIEQTLSTSPVNTYSVMRPMKAVLDDFTEADIAMAGAQKALLSALDDLQSDLGTTPGGSSLAGGSSVFGGANDVVHVDAFALDAAIAQLDRFIARTRNPT